MKDLLSIIVPVYNTESLLPRCIDSVLNQCYQNWELILVNDGSTDRSLDVCKSYADKDARIRVFSQTNSGQSAARNLGLKHTRGHFVTFLDSDDSVEPETYQAALEVFVHDEELDIVQFPVNWVTPSGVIRGERRDSTLCSNSVILEGWLKEVVSGVVWDKIYRRDLISNIQFKCGILFEDNLIISQILVKAKRVRLIPFGAYNYIQTEFTEDKWQWSDKKSRDTIISMGGILETLLGLPSVVEEIRVSFYHRFVNVVWEIVLNAEQKCVFLRLAEPFLGQIRISEVLHSSLPCKGKVKVVLSALYGRFALRKSCDNEKNSHLGG